MVLITRKTKYFFPALLAGLIIVLSQFPGQASAQRPRIGSDIYSTFRIYDALCNNPRFLNRNVVSSYYDCYNDYAGRQQVLICQERHFGNIFNSVEVIASSCTNARDPLVLYEYQNCLMEEFQNARISTQYSLNGINACQARTLGIY